MSPPEPSSRPDLLPVSSRSPGTASPSPWINPQRSVWCVLIEIAATSKPDRILTDEMSNIRVIVPERIVVKPGLPIQILTLKTQILRKWFGYLCSRMRDCVPCLAGCCTPGRQCSLPHQPSRHCAQLSWCPVDVAAEVHRCRYRQRRRRWRPRPASPRQARPR